VHVPTYPYACTACDHRFEQVQAFSDPSLTECPVCGGRLRKVFSSVGIVFKGSGFYRNDARAGAGSSSGSSESSGSSSGEKTGSDRAVAKTESGGKSDSGAASDSGSTAASSSSSSTSGSSASSAKSA
jgi:putative FmdB family regulatory protein